MPPTGIRNDHIENLRRVPYPHCAARKKQRGETIEEHRPPAATAAGGRRGAYAEEAIRSILVVLPHPAAGVLDETAGGQGQGVLVLYRNADISVK